MHKFYIETYGCQMNVADSELIATILTSAGFIASENIESATIIIFNTCSVRENAEQRVIGRISNEVSRKLKNKAIRIGIVGCMAQRLGESLFKINKKIDFVVGVDQYNQLPQIILGCISENSSLSETELNTDENYVSIVPQISNPLNTFVTIMRGCNNFCTYCIVPYTRGRERSRSVDEILNEIGLACSSGVREVTLLGQNVNSYHSSDVDFADLLNKINAIDGLKRIRFVTSHPKDISDKLIETMATCSKVCPHIHLPLQSGNDEILTAMNRGYTAKHYKSRIEKLRETIPGIAITTDVIAGFPGESETQFLDTLNLMADIRFDFAYMFRYSERSGTSAVELPNSIPVEVRLERLQRLIDQQTAITTEKYKARIGSIEEIFVECASKRDSNEMSGKTRDFKITVFEGSEDLIGHFVQVKIDDAMGWTLRGSIPLQSLNLYR